MDDREPITEAAVKKMLVGDTIEMRVQREALDGEARDRVVPVIEPAVDARRRAHAGRLRRIGGWRVGT